MYCTGCGIELSEGSKFCSQCGRACGPVQAVANRPERLVRLRNGKKIAGVCAGFARYLNVDVTLIRIVWAVLFLTAGVGLIAYIVAWIAMPYGDDELYSQPNADRHPVPNG